jgi:hypothetical protein
MSRPSDGAPSGGNDGDPEEEEMLGSEDEASFSGSSSDDDDDDEEEEGEESPEARERALAEARAMLRDRRGGKGRGKLFEEEVSFRLSFVCPQIYLNLHLSSPPPPRPAPPRPPRPALPPYPTAIEYRSKSDHFSLPLPFLTDETLGTCDFARVPTTRHHSL